MLGGNHKQIGKWAAPPLIMSDKLMVGIRKKFGRLRDVYKLPNISLLNYHRNTKRLLRAENRIEFCDNEIKDWTTPNPFSILNRFSLKMNNTV